MRKTTWATHSATPASFIVRSLGGLYDWYTHRTERGYQNDYLWNDWDNRKGIFDPCPSGWRLPGTKWGEVTTQWDNTNNPGGNTVDNQGRLITILIEDKTTHQTHHVPITGYYGIDGYLTGGFGDVSPNEPCFVLSNATPVVDDPAQGSVFFNNSFGIAHNFSFERAAANPVRCVKE